MKLDYLHDLTDNGKYTDVVSENLIRLWNFTPNEALQFQNLIVAFIAADEKASLALHEQDFIEAMACELTLVKDPSNTGITRLGATQFVCRLDIAGYQNMVELLQPFVTDSADGYQWLDEQAHESSIDFLFSLGGGW